MYQPIIKTFFNRKQVLEKNIEKSTSKSPLKPLLLLKHLDKMGLYGVHFKLEKFKPFVKEDFLIAHTSEYVEAVFNGTKPLCESNRIPWSDELVQSLTYTNASLYNAIEQAVLNPEFISFSPTSGFHHAMPDSGMGFCTFSGQVIASVKLYRKYGYKTAWLDLDGHFGNSIEDSREFVPDLNHAVPDGFNINPKGLHKKYIQSLNKNLEQLEEAVLRNEIHCVVWCHGADSHVDDDLGNQCTTDEWIECSAIFYNWVKRINEVRQKPLPVVLSLFGGYRADDYESVLSLHSADIICCLNTLCNAGINNQLIEKQNIIRNQNF